MCRSQLRQGCVLATAKLVVPIHRSRRLAQCGELKVVIGQDTWTRARSAAGDRIIAQSFTERSFTAYLHHLSDFA